MAELIALGKGKQQRWWQSLPEGETILLGRAPRHGWSVPWDRLISREHAHLRLADGKLHVEELETARNPIFFEGAPSRQFTLEPNGEFRIGDTTFRFEVRDGAPSGIPTVIEHTLGDLAIPPGRIENANACLEAICRLPALISHAHNDADFANQMVDLLLESLGSAQAAAVIQFRAVGGAERDGEEPHLIRWNSRDDDRKRFRPSRRLMSRALERQQSVVHLWSERDETDPAYTMTSDLDWAFCTPIPMTSGERWCLYVSGRRQFSGAREVESPADLIAELKLAELMAHFIGAIRHLRTLERQHAEMRQFFSPAVIETLQSESSGAALAPRQGRVSVLFCDVRGFSRKVEQSRDDLQSLLGRVSEALSVMTRNVLKYEGVIADFQGDAILAFWGWPAHSEDAAQSACRAALSIHDAFALAQHDPNHLLNGFHVGIGVGLGEAIAGRIGAQEQMKVGVFGPVVNLASRLQDVTKFVQSPILIDEPTASALGRQLPPGARATRRVARLRPAGVSLAVDAYALVSVNQACSSLTREMLEAYDQAVANFIAGDWENAQRLLKPLPADDGPAQFLKDALASFGGRPPNDWDGALVLNREGIAPPSGN